MTDLLPMTVINSKENFKSIREGAYVYWSYIEPEKKEKRSFQGLVLEHVDVVMRVQLLNGTGRIMTVYDATVENFRKVQGTLIVVMSDARSMYDYELTPIPSSISSFFRDAIYFACEKLIRTRKNYENELRYNLEMAVNVQDRSSVHYDVNLQPSMHLYAWWADRVATCTAQLMALGLDGQAIENSYREDGE